MPYHDQMPELLSYFELTYFRGRRRPGRGENKKLSCRKDDRAMGHMKIFAVPDYAYTATFP